MIPLPSSLAAVVREGGKITPPWQQYLQQFTQAPPNVLDITVGISPYSYQAKEPGNLAITGGTVSQITLTRGQVSIDVSGSILVPVSINDIVEVTYSVLPDIQFLPSYGNRTG